MYSSTPMSYFSKSSNSIENGTITSGSAIIVVLGPTYYSLRSPTAIAIRYDGTGILYSKK